jgi:hypothetical protein
MDKAQQHVDELANPNDPEPWFSSSPAGKLQLFGQMQVSSDAGRVGGELSPALPRDLRFVCQAASYRPAHLVCYHKLD